ncbi:MAG TPA: murein L,D-transpeptidase catalytic domain family protein [Allosphingosinicella sp.]
MLLSRRQFVECGAASAALGVMSSPLVAQVAEPVLRMRPDRDLMPPPTPTYPARARVTVDPQVDPRILARARAAFDRHRSSITHVDTVGIVDFTKASGQPRFYLVDANTGRVTSHLVAHGRGSDPSHSGFVQRFSNQPRSEASSNGAYVTTQYYPGHYGRSMRVRGLDYTNSNAEDRAIVIHSAWYAEPGVLATNDGRLGRSEGCFAFPYASLQEVLARLGPGRFLYADRLYA